MAALVLDMTSRVLLKVVLLQVKQQQGKPKWGRGREKKLSFTFSF
jgi:hypothetical protein